MNSKKKLVLTSETLVNLSMKSGVKAGFLRQTAYNCPVTSVNIRCSQPV